MAQKKPGQRNDSSQIHIGILEIRRHVPILYSFLKICDTAETTVTLFTTQQLYERLQTYLDGTETYQLILKKPHEPTNLYLRRIESYSNQHLDMLLINTIHETIFDLLYYLTFHPKILTILTIHHVNAWLKPYLIGEIWHPLFWIDTNISSVLIKGFIAPKFDAFNVIYKPLKQYIRQNNLDTRPIFTLPTSIYDPTTITSKMDSKSNQLKIVIPGIIQEHRKDYQPVIEAVTNLPDKLKKLVTISILGIVVGRFGRKIYKQFLFLKSQGINIEIYKEFVPDELFDSILKESNIILAPIRIQTRADNLIKETYGKSVGSGVIYNAIQYAKPLIVPKPFNLLPELTTSTLVYNNETDLRRIIINLLENPPLRESLQKNAINNAEKFSIPELQKYLQNTLLPWIKNNASNKERSKNLGVS